MCAMYENLSFKIINSIVTFNELYVFLMFKDSNNSYNQVMN
jgi:hypothetical protein